MAAKRSRSKPSRKQRKEGRERIVQAERHGLPSRPSRESMLSSATASRPSAGETSQTALDEEVVIPMKRTLSSRIGEVSLPVKIAIVLAVGLAVVWVFKYAMGPGEVRRELPPVPSASQP